MADKNWGDYSPQERKRIKLNLSIIAAAIVVAVLIFAFVPGETDEGSLADRGNDGNSTSLEEVGESEPEIGLPEVDSIEFINQEALLAYTELKDRGYSMSANFHDDMLTEMNGNAGDMLSELDYNNPDDRASVDAFKVGSLIQDRDNIRIVVVHKP